MADIYLNFLRSSHSLQQKLYIHVTVHRNRFLFNNQPDALIIQIYSIIKPRVSRIFSDHHQEFSTLHSALVSFMQVFDDHFQAESGWSSMEFHPDSACVPQTPIPPLRTDEGEWAKSDKQKANVLAE